MDLEWNFQHCGNRFLSISGVIKLTWKWRKIPLGRFFIKGPSLLYTLAALNIIELQFKLQSNSCTPIFYRKYITLPTFWAFSLPARVKNKEKFFYVGFLSQAFSFQRLVNFYPSNFMYHQAYVKDEKKMPLQFCQRLMILTLRAKRTSSSDFQEKFLNASILLKAYGSSSSPRLQYHSSSGWNLNAKIPTSWFFVEGLEQRWQFGWFFTKWATRIDHSNPQKLRDKENRLNFWTS